MKNKTARLFFSPCRVTTMDIYAAICCRGSSLEEQRYLTAWLPGPASWTQSGMGVRFLVHLLFPIFWRRENSFPGRIPPFPSPHISFPSNRFHPKGTFSRECLTWVPSHGLFWPFYRFFGRIFLYHLPVTSKMPHIVSNLPHFLRCPFLCAHLCCHN